MAAPSSSKDKFLREGNQPLLVGGDEAIEMRDGVLHIRDVQGPKKTETMEPRLEAVEQEIFKCQGMVEH